MRDPLEAECPVCEEIVIVADDATVGDIVTCSFCNAELMVRSMNPVSLEEMLIDDDDDDDDLLGEDGSEDDEDGSDNAGFDDEQ